MRLWAKRRVPNSKFFNTITKHLYALSCYYIRINTTFLMELCFFSSRFRIVDKFHMKNVEQKKYKSARRCQSKNVECIINRSATRSKKVREDVRRFLFINLCVRKCRDKSAKQHTQKDVKPHIRKLSGIKKWTNAYGLQKNKISTVHKWKWLPYFKYSRIKRWQHT